MRIIECKIYNSVKHEGKLLTEKYVVLYKTLLLYEMTIKHVLQRNKHCYYVPLTFFITHIFLTGKDNSKMLPTTNAVCTKVETDTIN